jgi:hypothetical protein
MRARTKIDIPNRSESEFENFDRAVKAILTKKKNGKKAGLEKGGGGAS